MMLFVLHPVVISTGHHPVSSFGEIDKILPIFNSLCSTIVRGIFILGAM